MLDIGGRQHYQHTDFATGVDGSHFDFVAFLEVTHVRFFVLVVANFGDIFDEPELEIAGSHAFLFRSTRRAITVGRVISRPLLLILRDAPHFNTDIAYVFNFALDDSGEECQAAQHLLLDFSFGIRIEEAPFRLYVQTFLKVKGHFIAFELMVGQLDFQIFGFAHDQNQCAGTFFERFDLKFAE